MELESFRVQNFRSIFDSGEIEASQITALLGRNESGKTNLLLALRTLNPPEGFQPLSPIKDFPRHRKLSDCSDNTEVVNSRWRLTPEEQKELSDILARASTVTHVNIGRLYGNTRSTSFENLRPFEFDKTAIQKKLSKLVAALEHATGNAEEPQRAVFSKVVSAFRDSTSIAETTKDEWATRALPAFSSLEQQLSKLNETLWTQQETDLSSLKQLCQAIIEDAAAYKRAEQWAIAKLPVFIYLAEYPELAGHQNITQYAERKSKNQLTEADRDFEKLCKVAGLDPLKLNQLSAQEKSEERNQLANRASAVVTGEIKRLWRDRSLKVRFNLDAAHFDTLISDPTNTFDVEVNLDERSRGFRWFFSFYITFSAETDGGAAKDAILLLDEPGLYLHIQSQKDLLAHWEKDFDNQIIFTTHSPFMIPIQTLDCLRTVNITEEEGTTVTNNPTGDGRTLAPIRAALGYYYADTLFIAANNLIVEGVTDWWILEAVSKHLIAAGKSGLAPGLAVCPVDGAPKVPNMVSVLTAQHLNTLVLFDEEKQARNLRDEIVSSKLIREDSVIFVSEAFAEAPSEADIEDLLDPKVYEELVRESYSKELKGQKLDLNPKVPRIVKRFEAAFAKSGLPFHKTRPAGLFFRKMVNDPKSVMTPETSQRFETLFLLIWKRLERSVTRAADPFH